MQQQTNNKRTPWWGLHPSCTVSAFKRTRRKPEGDLELKAGWWAGDALEAVHIDPQRQPQWWNPWSIQLGPACSKQKMLTSYNLMVSDNRMVWNRTAANKWNEYTHHTYIHNTTYTTYNTLYAIQPYNTQHTTHNIQHATYNIQHTHNTQHSTHSVQQHSALIARHNI